MTPDDLAKNLFREIHVKKDGMAACPFCGSSGTRAEMWLDGVSWTVLCDACGSYGPYTEAGGYLLALEAWGRRTDVPKDWLLPLERGVNYATTMKVCGMENLKACPFCGHSDLAYEPGHPSNSICCRVCDAAGAVGNGSVSEACEAWNRRVG